MALLYRLPFVFILMMSYWMSICNSTEVIKDLRVAEPNFSKLCHSYTRHVIPRSQKIICIFCKGLDVSCFATTTPVTTTTTVKAVPSSSVKSTLPLSSSSSVVTAKPTTSVTEATEANVEPVEPQEA